MLIQHIVIFPNQTFKQYSATVQGFLNSHKQIATRIDLVIDVYIENSLNAATKAKRGRGMRQTGAAETPVPPNWPNFLRVETNKQELFLYLAQRNFFEKPDSS